MRAGRILTAIVGMGAVVVVLLSSNNLASGKPYSGGVGRVVVVPARPAAGATVTIQGSGLVPERSYSVRVLETAGGATTLGKVTADATGSASTKVDLPDRLPSGSHRIVLVGDADDGSLQTAEAKVVVVDREATGARVNEEARGDTPLRTAGLLVAGLLVLGLVMGLGRRRLLDVFAGRSEGGGPS